MKSDAEFEALSCEDKLKYLHEMLKCIKPECLERVGVEHPKDPKIRKRLGDFWVNLKDADQYNWLEYSYEDFVIGLWYSDPNLAHYSGSACDRSVGFPAIDVDVIPKKPEQWTFCDNTKEAHSWFNEANIKEGNIWVKLLCVHEDESEDDEDDD